MLPASENVNTLIETLGAAKQVDWDYKPNSGGEQKQYTIKGPAQVEVTIVQDSQVRDPQKAKQIPEHAGPDAHGKDFFRTDRK